MSVYFALMISLPLLLKCVYSISTNNHRLVVIIGFIVCSVFPFFTKYEDPIGLNYGYSYLWFVVLFFIGSYLRRINITEKCRPLMCFLGFILCGALNELIAFFSSRIPFLNGYTTGMYNSFVVCIQSVFLFLSFVDIRFSNKKVTRVIERISSLSMASYLFHCQEDFGPFFWLVTSPSSYANSNLIFIAYFEIVAGLYAFSLFFEFIRRKIMSIGNIENRIVKYLVNLEFLLYARIDYCVVQLLGNDANKED